MEQAPYTEAKVVDCPCGLKKCFGFATREHAERGPLCDRCIAFLVSPAAVSDGYVAPEENEFSHIEGTQADEMTWRQIEAIAAAIRICNQCDNEECADGKPYCQACIDYEPEPESWQDAMERAHPVKEEHR